MKIFSAKQDNVDVLSIEGRIDGLTASEIKMALAQAAADGQRFLAVNLSAVTYMSSAGLRVILQAHKSLTLIGGKLILLSVPVPVHEVLRLSGMDQFLHILQDGISLRDFIQPSVQKEKSAFFEFQGINFTYQTFDRKGGTCFPIGSADKLQTSAYGQEDVVRIQQGNIQFGTGLAVLGDDFDDSKNFFGESIVIGHHFFSFPAVKRPLVDYSYYTSDSQHAVNFLYGFGFKGEFSAVLHFEACVDIPTLENLAQAAAKIAGSGLFGMVVLGRSGGMLGMSLRKSPIHGNEPDQGSILDDDNFTQWVNFSLDGEDINKTIIAAGLVVKDRNLLSPSIKKNLPEAADLHFHSAIFDNRLISQKPSEFSSELDRVCREFEVEKVIHTLPESKIKSGFIGVMNLDNY